LTRDREITKEETREESLRKLVPEKLLEEKEKGENRSFGYTIILGYMHKINYLTTY
jgi:hypothetical protein